MVAAGSIKKLVGTPLVKMMLPCGSFGAMNGSVGLTAVGTLARVAIFGLFDWLRSSGTGITFDCNDEDESGIGGGDGGVTNEFLGTGVEMVAGLWSPNDDDDDESSLKLRRPILYLKLRNTFSLGSGSSYFVHRLSGALVQVPSRFACIMTLTRDAAVAVGIAATAAALARELYAMSSGDV